jgi:hypothetical protein
MTTAVFALFIIFSEIENTVLFYNTQPPVHRGDRPDVVLTPVLPPARRDCRGWQDGPAAAKRVRAKTGLIPLTADRCAKRVWFF